MQLTVQDLKIVLTSLPIDDHLNLISSNQQITFIVNILYLRVFHLQKMLYLCYIMCEFN